VHDFASALRAVFAMCIAPQLLAVMIIGSWAMRRYMIPSRALLDTEWVSLPYLP
jgi:uncharacterized membrane protein